MYVHKDKKCPSDPTRKFDRDLPNTPKHALLIEWERYMPLKLLMNDKGSHTVNSNWCQWFSYCSSRGGALWSKIRQHLINIFTGSQGLKWTTSWPNHTSHQQGLISSILKLQGVNLSLLRTSNRHGIKFCIFTKEF